MSQGDWKRIIAAAVTVFLLIADANGWFKVPESAITLIGTVFIGSSALVGVANRYAIGKLVEGATPTTEQQQQVADKL